MTSSGPVVATVSTASATDGFDGAIAPVPVSPAYRLGLAAVALFMLLLPLVYVGLVALVGWGLVWHATENASILDASGSAKGRGLVYFGPLVVGAILILFMIKPLFARRPRPAERVSLDRGSEPLLFAFVERLCAVVGAPAPRRIDVDHQVNASASFRRGMASLFGNDLVLTIGLPLVAGMNLRQLTGVLAHEFGHFAQGGGMRLTYVIRSVNGWFARVVYERDVWDVRLAHWSKSIDLRAGIILYVARFFVWLTRKVLWALMMAGHAVSCFMMRQMEFDADRYEARVSGSDTFEATALRLHELNVANARAFRVIEESWREGRLADDLPALIEAGADRIPADVRQKILEHVGTAKTGALDTHPSDKDRIASARRENATGVFRSQEPARTLFGDFEGLSREVTRAYYRQQLEQDVPAERLVPVAALLATASDSQAATDALSQYFRGALSIQVPFWPERPPGARDSAEALRGLGEARAAMERLAPTLRPFVEQTDEANGAGIRAAVATSLMRAGFQVDAAALRLRAASHEAAEEALLAAENTRVRSRERWTELHGAAARRIVCAWHLMDDPRVRQRIGDPARVRTAADGMIRTLEAIRSPVEELPALVRAQVALSVLLENREDGKSNPAIDRELERLADDVTGFLERLRTVGAPHPFAEGATIGEHLVPEPPAAHGPVAASQAAAQAIERLQSLYFRALGALTETACRVESALGPPPPG